MGFIIIFLFKVCIYQATYRIMMGANPMKTKRLLQKGIQDGRTDIDGKY